MARRLGDDALGAMSRAVLPRQAARAGAASPGAESGRARLAVDSRPRPRSEGLGGRGTVLARVWHRRGGTRTQSRAVHRMAGGRAGHAGGGGRLRHPAGHQTPGSHGAVHRVRAGRSRRAGADICARVELRPVRQWRGDGCTGRCRAAGLVSHRAHRGAAQARRRRGAAFGRPAQAHAFRRSAVLDAILVNGLVFKNAGHRWRDRSFHNRRHEHSFTAPSIPVHPVASPGSSRSS
eukprot:ctg_2431.g567